MAACAEGASEASAVQSVWLDCDPGHDDMLAIILAGHHPNLSLIGISTVHGNQAVQKTAINAARVCVLARLDTVDVVQGQATPLVRSGNLCPEIHGESGLDGTALLPHPDDPAVLARLARWSGCKAPVVMAEQILQSPTPVALVATGCLTNVALALTLYPELKHKLSRIVIMGGAIGVGNMNPVAEFNIMTDPEAARIVFDAGLEIEVTMIPLEVTHTALITPQVEMAIKAQCADRFAQCILELLSFFKGTYRKVFRMDEAPCHDPCAMAFLIDPSKFTASKMRVDIEAASTLTAGQTVCDTYHMSKHPKNATVATAIDVEWFWREVVASLGRAAPKGGHLGGDARVAD
eukprot:m.316139 g.316139  ORF g.316139 m.316139 type:complete len:349 (-) comp27538_c1_seq1:1606-2652(-)